MSGSPLGLDYAAVQATLELLGIPGKRRKALFADLCHMEREALQGIRERAASGR